MTPILSATLLRAQSDSRLVALVRQGHERAFEAIVERYRRPLHRHVRRVLPESRTEDALQQTFLKAWTTLQDGAEVRDLRPWLYRIAQNTALDTIKRAGYDYEELSESLRSPGGPDLDLERRTVMRETLAGVAALPQNQREALLRTAVDGESRAQIAHDLGLTDGAVRQLVHRARVTLRAAATAVTPAPMAIWAAGTAGSSAPSAASLAELGAAGGAGLVLKGGAALIAAGVLVTGPVALHDLAKHHRIGADTAAAASPSHTTPAATWVSNGGIGRGSSGTSASGTTSGGGNGPSRQASRHGQSGNGSSGSGSSRSGSGSEDHSGSGHGRDGSGSGDSSGRTPSSGDGGSDHSGSSSDSGHDHGGAPSGGDGSAEPPSDGSSAPGPSLPPPSDSGKDGSRPPDVSGRSGKGGTPEVPEPLHN
jgi:RNA polymerase sigma factor (sigma-70 family)